MHLALGSWGGRYLFMLILATGLAAKFPSRETRSTGWALLTRLRATCCTADGEEALDRHEWDRDPALLITHLLQNDK